MEDSAIAIEKVEDIREIMKYNVLATPALVIDEKVVCSGRIPPAEELKKFLVDSGVS